MDEDRWFTDNKWYLMGAFFFIFISAFSVVIVALLFVPSLVGLAAAFSLFLIVAGPVVALMPIVYKFFKAEHDKQK